MTPPKKRAPRADGFERERRLDQIRRWIGLCRPTGEIVRDAMAQWGHGRRSVLKYLRKAQEQMAAFTDKKIAAQKAEARQCYQALIDFAAGRLETTVERTVITEAAGPDGKPVRRVTVTRQKVLPAHAFRGILWARTRLDKINGLEKLQPIQPPIGIDVKFPVWCGNDPPKGDATLPAEIPADAPALPALPDGA